jgi:hypothetical protein
MSENASLQHGVAGLLQIQVKDAKNMQSLWAICRTTIHKTMEFWTGRGDT